MISSRKISIPLLVLFLLGTAVLLYGPTIHLFPSFIHAWTQSDRYAIALRFLDNGFDLFHPATFNYQTVDGVTRVDFPINEFIVALVMKITGSTSPAIFRIYTLCASLTGLIYLHLLSCKITGSVIKGWLIVLFVFFSPVYFYYQAGFIPGIPAVACLFAAYYYFFTYKESRNRWQLISAISFFLVAALMRFPFIIFLFATILQQGLLFLKSRTLSKVEVAGFASAFLIFVFYYLYNIHLGRIYGNMFLDEMRPAKSFSELKEILAEMYHHWGTHYFTWSHYLLGFFAFLAAGFSFMKKGIDAEKKKYVFNFLIALSGTTLYFVMMARQYYAHDYYFLDSFFVPLVLLFAVVLGSIPAGRIFNWGTWFLVLAVFTVMAGYSCNTIQKERYTTGTWDRTEMTRLNFTGTDKFLEGQGIPKEARILVIDAYTTNTPLILMNRKGYTVRGTTPENISLTMAWAKWDLVAIQDEYLVSDVVHSYPLITSMLERVMGNGKVSFYRRSKEIKRKTLQEFIGIREESILKQMQSGPGLEIFDKDREYGLTFSATPDELKNETGLKALVDFDFSQADDLSELKVVASVGDHYQDFRLTDYFRPSDRWQHAEFQFVLPDVRPEKNDLKIYIWNAAKKDLRYKNWEVIVYK